MAPFCPRCGRPQASGIVCPDCWQRPTKIDGVRSPFRFDGAVRKSIHELKYRNLKAISPCLGELLAYYLNENPLPGEVLVSVPLHPRRLRERGYNQSALLAKELGKSIDLPVIEACLVRVKQAQPQVRAVDVEERRRNVADAFVCRDDKATGKQIILVDDVCTSGATLESCAAALKDRGATSVWGLTLARDIRN
jgi:ComF family protein